MWDAAPPALCGHRRSGGHALGQRVLGVGCQEEKEEEEEAVVVRAGKSPAHEASLTH